MMLQGWSMAPHETMKGKTLIMSFSDRTYVEGFDRVIEFDGVRVSDYGQSSKSTAGPQLEPVPGE